MNSSINNKKLFLSIISLTLYLDYVFCIGCDSNKQLYTEIGCTPIYSPIYSNSCPIAYNCENVFTRPSNKCYYNGNVYNPEADVTTADLAINPCLAGCFCSQTTYDNKTTTKFTCTHVQCPAYFTAIVEPCYFQYDKDSCCEIKTYCAEDNATIHTCVYDGNTYKIGQRFNVGDGYQCVCSPEFNGTTNDRSCRKVGCSYELLHMENILKLNAPVYFEKVDGCPINWYDAEYNVGTVEQMSSNSSNKSSSFECNYGVLSIPLGQKLRIDKITDSDTYKTVCSCNTPPLVTCVTDDEIVCPNSGHTIIMGKNVNSRFQGQRIYFSLNQEV